MTFNVSSPKEGLSIWDYLKYNVHGPLHSFVVYLFQLVSARDWWLRLPSALAGAGAVWYMYRWGRLWLGPRIAGFGAILFAVHPLLIYYSQELRNYSFLVFFTTFSSYYLHRILTDESRKNFLLYTAGIVLAVLSNFSAVFLFGVHSLIYLVRRQFNAKRLWRWAAVVAAVVILASPWIYRIYTFIDFSKLVTPVIPGELATTDRLRGETTVSLTAVPYLFYTFSVGFSLGPSLRELHHDARLRSVMRRHGAVVVWVAALFGGLGLVGMRRLVLDGGSSKQAALYIVVPLVAVLFLCWQNAKAFNVRYLLVALPAYLCVLGAGMSGVGKLMRPIAVGAVAVTYLVSLGNAYFNPRYGREDVRGAAKWVEERAAEGACILVPTVTQVFQHYFPRGNPVHAFYAPPGTPQASRDAQFEKILASCQDVWYVRSREWVDDPTGYLVRALGERYLERESIDLHGVKVIHYIR